MPIVSQCINVVLSRILYSYAHDRIGYRRRLLENSRKCFRVGIKDDEIARAIAKASLGFVLVFRFPHPHQRRTRKKERDREREQESRELVRIVEDSGEVRGGFSNYNAVVRTPSA